MRVEKPLAIQVAIFASTFFMRYPGSRIVVSRTAVPSYLEIIEFIAGGTTPQAVADYRPSPEAQRRIAELTAHEKEGSLSVEEKSELDHFMDLEHILRVAKARARQILASGS